jgi:RNA polymerase sigma-70 factor (ECF subfamily)
MGIATHQARNWLRKRQRRQQHESPWEELGPGALETATAFSQNAALSGPVLENDDEDDMDPLLSGPEAQKRLQCAMASLDARYRSVLLLRFQQELSYEAIATNLQVPLNTVRTWLRRGKDKLKQALLADNTPLS